MSAYDHLTIAESVLKFMITHFNDIQTSYIDESIGYIIEELKEAHDGIKEEEEE